MTSANVTYYQVYKDGKLVKEHSQSHYCTWTIRERLKIHQPPQDYILITNTPDEDEEDHFTEQMSLADFLAGKQPEELT